MAFYSTNDRTNIVDLKEAVLNAFPKDKGLYLPEHIPHLDKAFITNLEYYSFPEIGFIVANALTGQAIPESDLYQIVESAINFPAPLIQLNESLSILELFHGPTMAFKDFGARFMAKLMAHFLKSESRETTILVATSGDTGGAVAAGFYDVPGINVIILYPSGKVSPLQEKQLTSWGKNITAIEVSGVFDDCQALVKEAFIDNDLSQRFSFSSANSINIARLIPQSFYYFEAYKQIENKSKPVIFSVPSGNYGNLTAGVLAHKLGLPIYKFIAASNTNNVVPEYLESGNFLARPSIETMSNAMDVGNPSNFARLQNIYASGSGSTWNNIKKNLVGYSYGDLETLEAINEVYKKYNYIIDPHGAVGYLAANDYCKLFPDSKVVVFETAHPGKFDQAFEKLKISFDLPSKLKAFENKKKQSLNCTSNYSDFKDLLLSF